MSYLASIYEQHMTYISKAFYPKNRSKWKALSSWEPPEKGTRTRHETVLDTRFPQEVRVKKGYTWTQQLGIAIAALVDDGKTSLIEWTKQLCRTYLRPTRP